ncbi:beta-galactosidase [Labedella gwakjiensis]|uniref:Beta-galactosidase n=1 Tax=Labedella gwakjiensis TaxID=390269 RepID=A0A2P8GXI8_9MICO|nr:beta-galactosidase family protein [Labedella gwakjiensis]PSL38692.1 beta-galactosidase [Labedella gwakjiensis]RUQ86813.1 beta-galactosidase [Labedella gwakjiensis]
MADFRIGDADFLLDGEPHRILSGALHYFRVHPDEWRDRIRAARLLGLNTIETYVPWNLHARTPDTFDLDGRLDLGRFLDDVAAEGMHAIVRPGPYICAEWDGGGLPAWLFIDGETGVRRNEPRFLAAIATFFDHLAPVLVPRQIDRSGPIVLVQIENEYGAYGDDADYLRALIEMNRGIGLTVPFITVDQPTDEMLSRGSLPELHRTGSFGSRATERLATLRRHQPTGPLMSSEFWIGWFDHWGAHHHTTPVDEAAGELDTLLAAGASVNIYMFHGGTNFGFTNGANDKGVYQPTVTSYDYDALLDESGAPTAKYWAFREVLSRYTEVPTETPAGPAIGVVDRAGIDRVVPLSAVVDRVDGWTHHDDAPTMDEIGHYSGYVLYRLDIDTSGPVVLACEEVRDRAQVFVDGSPVGVLSRDAHENAIVLPGAGSRRVEVLVEDQGRVNYGVRIGEPKGLIGPVTVGGESVGPWSVLPLALDDPARDLGLVEDPDVAGTNTTRAAEPAVGPAFHVGTVEVSAVGDLHLDSSGWGKGAAWVNGFPLGRYWSRGPQHTLRVPAPVLRVGTNEIVIFETGTTTGVLAFRPTADLGHTEF